MAIGIPTVAQPIVAVDPATGKTTGLISRAWFNFLQLLQSEVNTDYDYEQPLAGFSLVVGPSKSGFILDPAGTLATGTITMPQNPMDGQIVGVSTTQTITALTVAPNAGQSVKALPSTLAAGTSFAAQYVQENMTWYPAP
jgi:hypothetical protein